MEKVVVMTGSVLNLPSAVAVMIMAATAAVLMALLFLHHKHFGVRIPKESRRIRMRIFIFRCNGSIKMMIPVAAHEP
jgi:hypothetical protein